DRAGIGHSMRLARGPLRVKLGHFRPQQFPITRSQIEFDAGDDEASGQSRAAIGEADFVARERPRIAVAADAVNQRHNPGDLAAESTRVHHKSAAGASRYSLGE